MPHHTIHKQNVPNLILGDIRKLGNATFKSVFEDCFTTVKNDYGTDESKYISFSME